MVQISRTQENVVLVLFSLASLIGLILTVHYVITPSIPHQERINLISYTEVQVMDIETYPKLQHDHPISSTNSNLSPPGWLSIRFWINYNHPSTQSFSSYLDLPYGEPGQNYTDAIAPALGLIQRHPAGSDLSVLYVDASDHNNAFMNESTGSTAPDYSRTYDSTANPPTLVIWTRVGDGIKVGGGFLLCVCIVCFLLPAGIFLIRCWEDKHPVAQSLSEHEAEQQRIKAREKTAFTPLSDEPDDSAHIDVERVDYLPSTSRQHSSSSRFVSEIEMDEKHQPLRDEEIMVHEPSRSR